MNFKELQFDVVIVGAGPAGSSTAISLLKEAPHLKVALIEKTSFEKKRNGEMLKPHAQFLLEELGIWQSFLKQNYSPGCESRTIWGTDGQLKNEFISGPEEFGWELDRRVFDTFLFEQASQSGVETFSNLEMTDYRQNSDNGWSLTLQNLDKEKVFLKTSFLVDATGRSCSLALKQGANRIRIDNLIGVFTIFKYEKSLDLTTYGLVETCPNGWWYSVPLPGDQIVAAYMTDNDIAKELDVIQPNNWWNLIKNSKYTYNRIKNLTPLSNILMRTADSFCLDKVHGDGWASVGDAAGSVDPLSGYGITWAIHSGINLAPSIINWLNGDKTALLKYQQKINDEYEKYLFERLNVYSLEKRWINNTFWQRHQGHLFIDELQQEILTRAKHKTYELKKYQFFNVFPNLKIISNS